MDTTRPTYDTYIQTSRANFANGFRKMIRVEQELANLNRATDATDQTFGYTAPFGDPEYVQWQDRDPNYAAIYKALDASRDATIDDYHTHTGAVTAVFGSLTHDQVGQVIALVESFLTDDSE